MTGDEPGTIGQILFNLTLTFCEKFPALDPFSVRSKRFCEVIAVLSYMIRYPKKQPLTDEKGNELPRGSKVVRDKSGRVIRVMTPAKNDDWY